MLSYSSVIIWSLSSSMYNLRVTLSSIFFILDIVFFVWEVQFGPLKISSITVLPQLYSIIFINIFHKYPYDVPAFLHHLKHLGFIYNSYFYLVILLSVSFLSGSVSTDWIYSSFWIHFLFLHMLGNFSNGMSNVSPTVLGPRVLLFLFFFCIPLSVFLVS